MKAGIPKKAWMGHIDRCQICGRKPLVPVLSFGHMPRVHGHLRPDQLHEPETRYPLDLHRCPRCTLVQIDYAVDPRVLFPGDYPYHTGTTNMLVRNFRALADQVVAGHRLGADDLVVDIGSNDGTLLSGFKALGTRVLGIEPTDNAKLANRNGIRTLQAFFSPRVARDVARRHGRARVVTATNVFAHVNDLFGFLAGIKTLLAKDGVFLSESQYLRDVVETCAFDTFYDEHLRYYTLRPLRFLFPLAGMSLVDAERTPAAGGSIRVYAQAGRRPMSRRARVLMAEETTLGLHDPAVLRKFADDALEAKHALLALLLRIRRGGGRVASVGAPGRSNTLLNFARVDHTLLDYLCEWKHSPKIGLYAPGTRIPIVDEKRLIEDQPDYALVLSWHIGAELMPKIRRMGYRGKFILPLPVPRVVPGP